MKKSNPSNRFSAEIHVDFPDGPDGENILRWLNLQHCGKEIPPKKVSASHKESHYTVNRSRIYNLIFEVTKNGDWIYVGRKI